MRVAYLPGLSPADLNLLHMALGAALADPSTAPVAQAIYRLLEVSTLVVKDGWGSHKAKDFAAAMERMTPEQYAHRKVDDLRVLYDWPIVQQMGEVWKKDYPMLSARSWAQHKR
ncbi:MAG: hypothetical protein P3W87_008645 [Gammaproteobacteria bacterium]|nr:hypothetical protein [Gammaproteobacteria bacterium]